MKNPIVWLRTDQNVHRAFAVISVHELLDGVLFFIVSIEHSFFVAAGAWAFSFVSGILLGHWAIEAHDKHEHGDFRAERKETWHDPPSQPFQQLKFEKCKGE